MSRFTNPVFDAAEAYSQAGLSVIPIKPDGSKQPPVAWKEYQSHIAGPEERSRWWANGSNYGIAVICGQVSGNVEVLDFDDIHAFEEWGQVVKDLYPELARQLVVSQTPGPGVQVLYRCETPPPGNQVLARDINGQVKIETRAEGGYVIAPPSGPECHPNRKPYLLRRGSFTSLPVVKDAERVLLLGLAKQMDEAPPKPELPPPVALSPQPSGGRPGDDYNERGDHHALLTRHGWAYEGCHGGEEYWRRPDKDRGHSAEWSVEKQLFHVFSSNAAPFEPGRGYGLFHCFALLEHGGDFSAAAKALAAQGYGDKPLTTQTTGSLSPTADPTAPPQAGTVAQRLLPISTIMRRKPPSWVVPDLIQQQAHSVLFGPPNIGKTFVALSIGWCVANGQPWFGRPVRQGPVVYVAAEGGYGLTVRALALSAHVPGKEEPPFYVIEDPLTFLSPGDIGALVVEMQALAVSPILFIVDTLALSLAGGDENSSKDMGLYNSGIHQIRRGTGASILTIHHTNAEGTRERGHSALRGNAETMIEASSAAGLISLRCDKQRDARSFDPLMFSLIPVGESCVLGMPGKANGALKEEDVALLQALAFGGEPLKASALKSAAGLSETIFFRSLARLTACQLIAGQGVTRSAQRFYHITPNGAAALHAATGETGEERLSAERRHWE